MEELYNELMNYLQGHAECLGISVIDEDWGQLEALLNGEDSYPVTFPCLLISFGEAVWKDYKPEDKKQRGTMSITTRLAFDCYDDTHSGAEQMCYAAQRQRTAHDLHVLMQGVKPDTLDCSSLSRMASRTVSMPHGIKVYEADYTFRVTE